MEKKPEHPNMQGKSDEKILVEAKKSLVALKKSLTQRFWLVMITSLVAIIVFFGPSPEGWTGVCIMLGSICMFVAALILFTQEKKKVEETERLITSKN